MSNSLLFAAWKSKNYTKEVCLYSQLGANSCYLVSKGGKLLKEKLDLDEVEEKFCTDSKVVLGYITNDVQWFKTFVANRVEQIKDNTSGQWYYIPNKENPADSASRGLNAAQVNSIDCWFPGPPFFVVGYEILAKWRCHCRASK